jgi:hypothetical protein
MTGEELLGQRVLDRDANLTESTGRWDVEAEAPDADAEVGGLVKRRSMTRSTSAHGASG